MVVDLAAQFERDMLADSNEYRRITKTRPSAYLQMIQRHGGVETARRLMADPKIHDGLARAFECRCLTLTAEYLAVFGRDGIYNALFSLEELEQGRKKLKALGLLK